MKLVEIVRQASREVLTTEDGDPVPLELMPPLSDAELREFEAELPCPLPPDVRELLQFCSGFTGGPVDHVDFTGRGCDVALEDTFPHNLGIAADGFGNFWVIDLWPTSTTWGPIYYACHDAPVILYQSATLEEFLTELFKMSVPPYTSLVDDVHEDRLFNVWGTNPGVLEHAECVDSRDPELREFATQLGPTFQFIDLRNPQVGAGFSWGRYGPQTVVKRHGALPIFAYERREGLVARLLKRFRG